MTAPGGNDVVVRLRVIDEAGNVLGAFKQSLVGTAGAIKEVGTASTQTTGYLGGLQTRFGRVTEGAHGATGGLRLVKGALASVALESVGLEGPLGRIVEGMVLFGGGSAVVIGAAAGITIIAKVMKMLGDQAEFTKEQIKAAAEEAKKFQETPIGKLRETQTIDQSQLTKAQDKFSKTFSELVGKVGSPERAQELMQNGGAAAPFIGSLLDRARKEFDEVRRQQQALAAISKGIGDEENKRLDEQLSREERNRQVVLQAVRDREAGLKSELGGLQRIGEQDGLTIQQKERVREVQQQLLTVTKQLDALTVADSHAKEQSLADQITQLTHNWALAGDISKLDADRLDTLQQQLVILQEHTAELRKQFAVSEEIAAREAVGTEGDDYLQRTTFRYGRPHVTLPTFGQRGTPRTPNRAFPEALPPGIIGTPATFTAPSFGGNAASRMRLAIELDDTKQEGEARKRLLEQLRQENVRITDEMVKGVVSGFESMLHQVIGKMNPMVQTVVGIFEKFANTLIQHALRVEAIKNLTAASGPGAAAAVRGLTGGSGAGLLAAGAGGDASLAGEGAITGAGEGAITGGTATSAGLAAAALPAATIAIAALATAPILTSLFGSLFGRKHDTIQLDRADRNLPESYGLASHIIGPAVGTRSFADASATVLGAKARAINVRIDNADELAAANAEAMKPDQNTPQIVSITVTGGGNLGDTAVALQRLAKREGTPIIPRNLNLGNSGYGS